MDLAEWFERKVASAIGGGDPADFAIHHNGRLWWRVGVDDTNTYFVAIRCDEFGTSLLRKVAKGDQGVDEVFVTDVITEEPELYSWGS